MAKIIISIEKLIKSSLLKDVFNKLEFDEGDPKNIELIMIRDYANESLPEKYNKFKPSVVDDIEFDIDDKFALLALQKWVTDMSNITGE